MNFLGKTTLIALITLSFCITAQAQSEGYTKASSYMVASHQISAKSPHRDVASKKKHKKKKKKHSHG